MSGVRSNLSIPTKIRIYSTHITVWFRNLDSYTNQLEKTGLLSYAVSVTNLTHQLAFFVSNDEVLRRTGLLEFSFIVRKRQLGLFGQSDP